MKNRIKEVFHQEAEAIRNIPVTENFESATRLIYQQVHQKGDYAKRHHGGYLGSRSREQAKAKV